MFIVAEASLYLFCIIQKINPYYQDHMIFGILIYGLVGKKVYFDIWVGMVTRVLYD